MQFKAEPIMTHRNPAARLLKGTKALVVGIANEHSIAYGCAKAFRELGADLAITYLNEKAKTYVEPLAKELGAPIFMPLDVGSPGMLEAVFETIGKKWGRLDILVHSIAFAPQGRPAGRAAQLLRRRLQARRWISPAIRSSAWRGSPRR